MERDPWEGHNSSSMETRNVATHSCHFGEAVMRYFDLLLNLNGATLDSFAQAFFAAADVNDSEQRQSIHYGEERYFKGKKGGLVFKVMLSDDEDHLDLPFWVNIEVSERTDLPFEIEAFVRERLLSSGFKVARLINFGRPDEERCDFN
jgi:hypothetical protein